MLFTGTGSSLQPDVLRDRLQDDPVHVNSVSFLLDKSRFMAHVLSESHE